jgi:NADH-quinone oxidoreductase subunit A
VDNLLLLPPIAFFIVMAFVLFQVYSFSFLSFKNKNKPPGQDKAYACGEDIANHHLSPEYGQFFSFAFFFTIMHVVALLLATLPAGRIRAQVVEMDVLFIIGAVVALMILYRKKKS